MTPPIITVLVEGALSKVSGTPHFTRAISVGVGGNDETRTYPTSTQSALLCPWEWTIIWKNKIGSKPNSSADALSDEVKKAANGWVKTLLEQPHPTDDQDRTKDKRQLDSLWPTVGEVTDSDEPDEDDPGYVDGGSWVQLQMQLARLDATVSHGLALCSVLKVEGDEPNAKDHLPIKSVSVNGFTDPFDKPISGQNIPGPYRGAEGTFLGDNTDVDQCTALFHIICDDQLPDLRGAEEDAQHDPSSDDLRKRRKVGAIDLATRRVDLNQTDGSRGNWLAEVEDRIETLCDPVLTLLNVIKLAGEPPAFNPNFFGAKIDIILTDKPDTLLLPLLLADSDDNDGDDQISDWVRAKAWLAEFSKHLSDPNADLSLNPFKELTRLTSDPVDLGALRSFWTPTQRLDDKGFGPLLLKMLAETARTAGLGQKIIDFLHSEEAQEVVMGRLVPRAVAQREVVPRLANEAQNGVKDFDKFKARFPDIYAFWMARVYSDDTSQTGLLAGLLRTFAVQQEERIFALKDMKAERDDQDVRFGDDLAVRNGITIPVDTMFRGAVTKIDPHEALDGFVLALAQTNVPGADLQNPDWKLVTRGTTQLFNESAGKDKIVPGPLAIEQREYNPTLSDTSVIEQTQALISYNGASILPETDVEGDPLRLFGADGNPALVTGGKYVAAVGYSVLGGMLPDGFANDSPFEFQKGGEDELAIEVDFLRTMRPGAPELSCRDNTTAPGGTKPLVHAWTAAERDVRPLWKEDVERNLSNPRNIATRSQTDALIRGVRTKFLTPEGQPARVADTLHLVIAPPKLTLLPKASKGGDPSPLEAKRSDAMLRYWYARDEQFEAEVPKNTKNKSIKVSDPAVVGDLHAATTGSTEGKGGVLVRVYSLDESGVTKLAEKPFRYIGGSLQEPAAHKLECEIKAVPKLEDDHEYIAKDRDDKVIVQCPRGTSVLVEFITVVDAGFMALSSSARDARIDGEFDYINSENGEEFLALAGNTSLAIEALPAPEHMPSDGDLWHAITASQTPANTLEFRLKEGAAGFDYVGHFEFEWQEWRWDGGPIRWDDVQKIYNNPEGGIAREPEDAPEFAEFEKAYFVRRPNAGAIRTSDHSKGQSTVLATRPGSQDRGGRYFRARLRASGRYAKLMSAKVRDIGETVQSLPSDRETRWRGFAVLPTRSAKLPTPQIASLIPLGGHISANADINEQAGAFAIVMETGWYDPVNAAGLNARLECEIVEDKGGMQLDGKDVSLSTLGPIATSFGKEKGKDGNRKPASFSLKPLDEKHQRTIHDEGVIGLSLDPGSVGSVHTGSLAFFDARLKRGPDGQGGAEGPQSIPPDYAAMVRFRSVMAEDGGKPDDDFAPLRSDWSRACLIHFEPALSGADVNDDNVDRKAGEVTITAKKEPRGLLLRWTGILTDSAKLVESINPDPRMMRNGLLALAYARVTSLTGETVLRVTGAFPVAAKGAHGSAGSGLKLKGAALDQATHIRIFETAAKVPFNPDEANSLEDLAKALLPPDRAFKSDAQKKVPIFEPHQALMRVGPLITLPALPLA